MTLNARQFGPAWTAEGVEHVPIETARTYLDVDPRKDTWESPRYMEHLQSRIESEGLQHPLMWSPGYAFEGKSKERRIVEGNHRLIILERMGATHVPMRKWQGEDVPIQ